MVNPLTTNVPHHIETSQFGLQINLLFSICWGTLVVNGFRRKRITMKDIKEDNNNDDDNALRK